MIDAGVLDFSPLAGKSMKELPSHSGVANQQDALTGQPGPEHFHGFLDLRES
jgi:hypothetical protein